MSAFVNKLNPLLEKVSPYHGYSTESGVNRFEFEAPRTTIKIHAEGLGDLMIVRQFGRAIHDYFAENEDPELGEVIIATGGFGPAYHPDEGDINLYWWWSFGKYDDRPGEYLEQYLKKADVAPNVILCLSERCLNEAEKLGYETLYFPLGTQAFKPLEYQREGLGYAGSKSHKASEKERKLFGPYQERDDMEWVSHFIYPEQLNMWYNKKLVTFGMHKEGQRQYGMVNNRVFETLASGTPFVLEKHPTVDDVLGFDFPYQSSSSEETEALVKEIQSNPEDALEEFREYSKTVRKKHSYDTRVSQLIDYLS
jgi:hypothetical protein